MATTDVKIESGKDTMEPLGPPGIAWKPERESKLEYEPSRAVLSEDLPQRATSLAQCRVGGDGLQDEGHSSPACRALRASDGYEQALAQSTIAYRRMPVNGGSSPILEHGNGATFHGDRVRHPFGQGSSPLVRGWLVAFHQAALFLSHQEPIVCGAFAQL